VAPPRKGIKLDRTARALGVRMWRDWVRPHWPHLIGAVALMWLVAGTTSLYPLVIQQAFRWFEQKNNSALYLLPPLIILVTASKGAAVYAQSIVTNNLLYRIVANMQKALFAHLTYADMSRLAGQTTGHYVAHFLSDMATIRESLSRALTNIMRDCLTVLGLVGTMIYLDWQLTLLVFVLYPVAIYPLSRLGKFLRKVSAANQAQAGEMVTFLNESLSGARMVKTYNLEPYEIARGNETFEKTRRLLFKAVRSRNMVDPIMETLGGIAVAAVLAFTGWRIVYGGGSIGNLTGFISALLLAAGPMRAIGTLTVVVQEGFGALERVFNLMDEEPHIKDKLGALPLVVAQGQIALKNVTFTYGRETAAVENLSITIPAGTTAALVGPSGGGKSTVINLIPRLYDVTQGAVEIDGQDLRDVTIESLRDAIALVSQDVVLFNDTIRANIALGKPGASAGDIEAAARGAAAHDFIVSLPQGYETRVGENGSALSGGQRQRIAIARAMLKNAPILLLDEATSALDSESERQVQLALAELKKGRTTLVIAHRLSTVLDADRLFVMDGGHLVEAGTHAELLRQGGLYARLYRTQFAGDGVHGENAVLVDGKA